MDALKFWVSRYLKLLLFFFLSSIYFSCFSNSVVNGQVFVETGESPPFIFLRSFSSQDVDTVYIGKFGEFKLKLSATPKAYALVYGKGGFAFFVNVQKETPRLSITIKDGYIKAGSIEDSQEDKAYRDLENLFNVYDRQFYTLLQTNTPDSVLYLFISEYNRELNTYQNYYKGTYCETFANERMLPYIDSLKHIQAQLQTTFFSKINFNDSTIIENPFYKNTIELYLSILLDTSFSGEKKFISDLMSKAKVNIKVYKYTADYLFKSFLSGKNEQQMSAYIDWFEREAEVDWLPVLKAKTSKLKLSLPDNSFIDLEFKNQEGVNEKLSETIKTNKKTLLVIWESSCSHCQQIIPLVQKLYDKFKHKRLAVFAVSLDAKKAEWESYITDKKLDWINVYAGDSANAILDNYFLNSLPVLVLINQQGIIEHRFADVEQLDNILWHTL